MQSRRSSTTDRRPNAYALLIPLILMIFGWLLVLLHPYLSTGFIGTLIALTGAMTLFPIGVLYGVMRSFSRTHARYSAQHEHGPTTRPETVMSEDPFVEEFDDE